MSQNPIGFGVAVIRKTNGGPKEDLPSELLDILDDWEAALEPLEKSIARLVFAATH